MSTSCRSAAGSPANGRPGAAIRTVLFVCSLSFSSLAVAQGMNWMSIGRHTPMSQFNDRDVELFIEKGTAALDDPEDKVAKSWENPDTGNSGTITAMRSFTRDGVQCREVLIENQSRSFYSRNTHDFCRKSDGTWRWIPPSTP